MWSQGLAGMLVSDGLVSILETANLLGFAHTTVSTEPKNIYWAAIKNILLRREIKEGWLELNENNHGLQPRWAEKHLRTQSMSKPGIRGYSGHRNWTVKEKQWYTILLAIQLISSLYILWPRNQLHTRTEQSCSVLSISFRMSLARRRQDKWLVSNLLATVVLLRRQ